MDRARSSISFARLPIAVDHQRLFAELTELGELSWTPHVNQANYQGGWDVVALRCLREHLHAHPILQSFAIEAGEDWQNLPLLQQSPAIKAVIDNFQCHIMAVRFMRLKAGAYIKPHRDQGLALEYGQARLHLPLITDPKVEFVADGTAVPMQAGELWYINADRTHSVLNGSDQHRINLVIDCKANDWLREQIRAGADRSKAVS